MFNFVFKRKLSSYLIKYYSDLKFSILILIVFFFKFKFLLYILKYSKVIVSTVFNHVPSHKHFLFINELQELRL